MTDNERKFWQTVDQSLRERAPDFLSKTKFAAHELIFRVGLTHCTLSVINSIQASGLIVGLYIKGPERNAIFNQLHGQRADIDRHFDHRLIWQPQATEKGSSITISEPYIEDFDGAIENEQIPFVIDNIIKMDRVFRPLLRQP